MKYKRLKLRLEELNNKRERLEKDLDSMRDVSDDIRKWTDILNTTKSTIIKYKGIYDEVIEEDIAPSIRGIAQAAINRYQVYNGFKNACEKELIKVNDEIIGIEIELLLHPISTIQRKLYELGISDKFSIF